MLVEVMLNILSSCYTCVRLVDAQFAASIRTYDHSSRLMPSTSATRMMASSKCARARAALSHR
jgi:hypothetical protein